ncbi:hypothetical protein SCUCBS95973_003842 [Sporothrix curviconia]|uniref:CCHC-type domain-containing protein n=1 Tax=Sporothrix curviconia TaxID=1260050 RepID=A0ABP0BIS6_9PEZI
MARAVDDAASTDEQRKLKKYFPAVAQDAVFCIGCASYGHRITSCPLRSCRLCGSIAGDHTLFGCPAVSTAVLTVSEKPEPEPEPSSNKGRGGGKAKAKGKSRVATVPEANIAAPSQPAKCRYCLEDCIHAVACPLLWRTFVHNPASKRSADEMSVACYVCGLDDHFGGDCKDNTGEHISGRQYSRDDDIWSRKYALLFSDLTKTRPFPGFGAADGGNAAAAAAPPKRETKRVKTGRGNETANHQPSEPAQAAQAAPAAPATQAAPAAQAGGNASGKNKRKGKAKGKNKQAPSLTKIQTASPNKQAEQAGASPKSRKKRKASGQQQPASLNVALPNRPAAPNPAKGTPAAAQSSQQVAHKAPASTVPAAQPKPQPQSQQKKTRGGQAQAQTKVQATVQTSAQAPAQAPAQGDVRSNGQIGQGQAGQGQTGEAAKGKAKKATRRPRMSKEMKKAQTAARAANAAEGQGRGQESAQANGGGDTQAGGRRSRSKPRNEAAAQA